MHLSLIRQQLESILQNGIIPFLLSISYEGLDSWNISWLTLYVLWHYVFCNYSLYCGNSPPRWRLAGNKPVENLSTALSDFLDDQIKLWFV